MTTDFSTPATAVHPRLEDHDARQVLVIRGILGQRPQRSTMPSTLKSASVYLRKQHYYIHPLAGSKGGDPVLFMGPVTRLDVAVDPAILGETVLQAIRLSHHDAPWPTDWKNFLAPLLESAGVKSESTFMKGARSVRVDVDHDEVSLITTTSKIYPNAAAPLDTLKAKLHDPYELGLLVVRGISLSD